MADATINTLYGISVNYSGRKPKIGIPTPFEPFVGTLQYRTRDRLPGPPSDWPAPDRTYCRLKHYRYTSLVSTQVGLHLLFVSIVPTNGFQ